MLKNNKRQFRFLFIITLIGFLLRLFFATEIIPALNWDEISHGFNAYSVLKTGHDEWGITMPIIFRAYGDYKLPVYIYTTVAPVFAFGLSPLAVRLTSILAGTGSIIFTYFLVHHLTKKTNIAILSALLLAVEPWGLFISGIAAEANLALFLIISGSYFLISGLKQNPRSILIGALLISLSVWTYNSARIFVPLILFGYALVYRKDIKVIFKKSPKYIALSVIILTVFLIPMFFQLLSSSGQARYDWVRIIDQGAISQINDQRTNSILPSPLNRFAYNKATYFTKEFTRNYLTHYSPTFLFSKGGSHYQFNVQNHGLLYQINIIFFLIGVIFLLKYSKKNKNYLFILIWFVVAPIASALTKDTPHTLRSLIFLPTPQIITSLGVVYIAQKARKHSEKLLIAFVSVYLLALYLSLENYINIAKNVYKPTYSWAWQYGYEEVVGLVKTNYDKYDQIIITKKYGEPHEFILFYWPWDPKQYQSDHNLNRYFQTNWYWVDSFDKFQFINDWEIQQKTNCNKDNDCLLITSPDNKPDEWNKIDQINFLNGEPAFEIYENTHNQ